MKGIFWLKESENQYHGNKDQLHKAEKQELEQKWQQIQSIYS